MADSQRTFLTQLTELCTLRRDNEWGVEECLAKFREWPRTDLITHTREAARAIKVDAVRELFFVPASADNPVLVSCLREISSRLWILFDLETFVVAFIFGLDEAHRYRTRHLENLLLFQIDFTADSEESHA